MSTVGAQLETASCSRRFRDLRGVQWRIDLGILPSCPSASIDDLRRVTANSRRRYAALRRQLLVDPHVAKDGSSSPDLVMDNPLSQSPDSVWGRFFRNAELERMVDQDLTRLYPERGGYFQTSGCQGILRRVLLLWCLRHPEYGYRQGMHELLAPLLYVLHVDAERLSEVRKTHEDHFSDKFDGFSFHESDLTYKFDFKKFSESIEDGNIFRNCPPNATTLTELDPDIQTIILLSDAYGAEGELGIVLSEKFMEHDAYSMFDSLMSGGALSMSEFFSSPSHFRNSHSGFPPVIEASTALYHLLSIVDSTLYIHLVELGVEPQYFALRWLRVLFGREFSLENLLVVWDEIFTCENTRCDKPLNDDDDESGFGILESPRGAFICAFAVSMILTLRSSLLATENATSCLQRLLNLPDDVKILKLLAKAKSLHALALEVNNSISEPIRSGPYEGRKSMVTRGHSLPLDSTSPRTPLNIVADRYWEEKWKVLHEEKEEQDQKGSEKVQNRKKGWSERVKLRLSRTESDPTPSKNKNERNKIPKPSVRRSLLEDLKRQLRSDHQDKEIIGCDQDINHQESTEVNIPGDVTDKNYENASSEENSSNSSEPAGPISGNSENENESQRSSVASNSLMDENDVGPCGTNQECSPLPVSDPPGDGLSSENMENGDSLEKIAKGAKERKLLSGKFQWLWKLGKNASEGTLEKKSGFSEDGKGCNGESDENTIVIVSSGDGCDRSYGTSNGETVNQNLMVSLKNLSQSMLENIQVIESVFQQDRDQTGSLENLSKNGFVGKRQVTAMTALKELRKISNLLSEM